LTENNRARLSAWPAIIPALLFAALLFALAATPLPWRFNQPWIPSLGVELNVYVDGLSAQFLLLITGIGTMVFVYGSGYLTGDPGNVAYSCC